MRGGGASQAFSYMASGKISWYHVRIELPRAESLSHSLWSLQCPEPCLALGPKLIFVEQIEGNLAISIKNLKFFIPLGLVILLQKETLRE